MFWYEFFDSILNLYITKGKRQIAQGIINSLKNEIFSEEEDFVEVLSHLDDGILQNLASIIKFNYANIRNKRIEREQTEFNILYK